MDSLVAVADLTAYLQRPLDQPAAELALAGASGIVREYCGWTISAEAATFVVDGSGTTLIGLPTLHLTAVTEVRIDGLALEPAGYAWSENGLLQRRAGWPRRFRCVAVDCAHGYGQVPDVVRAVVLALAGRLHTNPDRLVSKTVGGISRTYATGSGDMSELELAMLAGLRLP
ncbi:MAG TPA: hypothetical protein VK453_24345 [Micromonosporaceae bacterium]|nr:hypothetical protein [Micromonosporaceae bacterium]